MHKFLKNGVYCPVSSVMRHDPKMKTINIKGLQALPSKDSSHIPLYIKLIGGFGIISLVTGFLFYFKASKLGSIKNAHT